MEILQDLVYWAEDTGVELNGIKPWQVPGRGIGVVTTRNLKVMSPVITKSILTG